MIPRKLDISFDIASGTPGCEWKATRTTERIQMATMRLRSEMNEMVAAIANDMKMSVRSAEANAFEKANKLLSIHPFFACHQTILNIGACVCLLFEPFLWSRNLIGRLHLACAQTQIESIGHHQRANIIERQAKKKQSAGNTKSVDSNAFNWPSVQYYLHQCKQKQLTLIAFSYAHWLDHMLLWPTLRLMLTRMLCSVCPMAARLFER